MILAKLCEMGAEVGAVHNTNMDLWHLDLFKVASATSDFRQN